MQSWRVQPIITPSPELLATVGGHPLVAQLLAQRGIDTPEKAIPFLDPDQYSPAPPDALIGVENAADLLYRALQQSRHVLVWGDFDVDGQTSTALLVTALRDLASKLNTWSEIRFHVPNRFKESHGIKVDSLQACLAEEGASIDLLVSCDTGIAEGPAVGFAKDQGLTVVITDHHDLSPEFQGLRPTVDPLWGLDAATAGTNSVRRADAVVNPKFQPPGDPLRTLPGVGVAFKLVQKLYALAGYSGEEDFLLDLVALGIVADVAEQVHDARYLLQRGLERLRTTQRIGLKALMHQSRVDPASLNAESIGFQLGPRMNALGRLEDATLSIELLTTNDALRAGELAAKLERLNQERQLLTRQITAAALEMVDQHPELLQFNALVLDNPHWHAGVVGIVASKLVEQFGKPTVMLLRPPGDRARGSARSAPGVDIGAAIAACSHLLLTHGGHPGAAGVSLLPENINAFRRALSDQIPLHRDDSVQTGLVVDAELAPQDLDMELVNELTRLAPFGQGNPMPILATNHLEVVEDRRIGREGTHRRLAVRAAGTEGPPVLPVIWFHGADAELPAGPLDLAYTLGINEYKGERTLQLTYVASRASRPPEGDLALPAPGHIPAVDLRQTTVDLMALPRVTAATWYAEGTALATGDQSVPYSPRQQATTAVPGRPLVVWSTPPSAEIWEWLKSTAQPDVIHLVARSTGNDTPPAVLRAVASTVKYAIGHFEGLLDIGRIAGRLGLTEASVRQALLCLQAEGMIEIVDWGEGDAVRIATGAGRVQAEAKKKHFNELKDLLLEIRAYRRFFQRATFDELGIGAK
ncbi:MAG: hypothetical protein IPK16_12960 [Anaerolineales bacterium]|nr:hypothetical protein [Anaerolineales bacterium]